MKVIEYTFAEYTDSRELLESRPPRVIPFMVLALALLLAGAFAYACLVQVEETVRVPGELMPNGQVQIYLPQTAVASAHPGQAVTVEFDAFPGQSFIGEVEDISDAPDEERRYAAGVALGGLLPQGARQGMTLQASLSCGQESVLRWMIEKMG